MNISARYEKAKALYLTTEKKSILNERIAEKWCTGSQDFWYARDIEADGEIATQYTRYKAEERAQSLLFCHDKMAAHIQGIVGGDLPDKNKLPITIHEVDDGAGLVYLSITDAVGEFVFDMEAGTLGLLRFPLHDPYEVTSPDKSVSVFVREYNLFMRCNESGKITQLTSDGEPLLEYARPGYSVSWKLLGKPELVTRPAIVFAPDSRHFLTYRSDARLCRKMNLIQSVPLGDDPRPIHVSYPYPLPGDEQVRQAQVFVGSVQAKNLTRVTAPCGDILTLEAHGHFGAEGNQIKWTDDGKTAYFLHCDRLFKNLRCVLIDAEHGTSKSPIHDEYQTTGFISWFGAAAQEDYQEPSLHYLPETSEVLWHSEIEGWSSLYLYCSESGALKRRLTPDGWAFRRLRHVDAQNRLAYFSAGGREEGIDPYYQMLYSVHLDSGEITLISPEISDHVSRFSPDGSYIIDTYSTVQTVPRHVVRDVSGSDLFEVATANIDRLIAAGYHAPEPFTALARDGETVIYGIILKPADFDPSKTYPVLQYTYGGQQRIVVPKSFQWQCGSTLDPMYGIQTASQLGFVSVVVDGFSTPLRSKAMHDVGYGHTEECCGLTDDVAAIRQLGEKYRWMDLDRVGIWGASGGGYATVRAMVQFPAFYKVGVSLCGNHDQAIYNAPWGERWMGAFDSETWKDQANHNFAENLVGKLLMVHGDLDDNVHPSASIKMTHHLIEANKDFEFLYYPNADHGLGKFPYITRRRWDFFVRHLLGETPPEGFTLVAPKEEK